MDVCIKCSMSSPSEERRGAKAAIFNRELRVASESGDVDAVKALVRRAGTDVNEGDGMTFQRGITPLHFAADSGNCDVVEILLQSYADIDKRTTHGWTATHYAAASGHLDVLELLFSKGPNLDITNNLGLTPLYEAAAKGHGEAVKFLLSKGANVAAQDLDGNSPLHFAVKRSKELVVKILLEGGADPEAKNFRGQSSLDLTRSDATGIRSALQSVMHQKKDSPPKMENGSSWYGSSCDSVTEWLRDHGFEKYTSRFISERINRLNLFPLLEDSHLEGMDMSPSERLRFLQEATGLRKQRK